MFLWTSRTLSNVPFLWAALWVPYHGLVIVFLVVIANGNPRVYYLLMDSLALLWLVLTWVGLGRWFGARKATLFVSINLVAFETLLGIFDRPEFFIHVTGVQAVYHVAAWFSNADLLVVALATSAALWVWIYRPAWLAKLRTKF